MHLRCTSAGSLQPVRGNAQPFLPIKPIPGKQPFSSDRSKPRIVCQATNVTNTSLQGTTVRDTSLPTTNAIDTSLSEEVTLLRRRNELLLQKLANLLGIPEDQVEAQLTSDLGHQPGPADVPSEDPAKRAAGSGFLDLLEAGIQWPHSGEQFWTRAPRSQPLAVGGGSSVDVTTEQDGNPLHIVHITAEMAPIAKVGGLGDVVTGLARSCLARGHHATVMLPFYESLPQDQIEDLKHERDLDVPKGSRWDGHIRVGSLRTSVYSGRIAGCPVLLLRPADWNACNIFRGSRIYGGSYNEMEAYLYFCRACLEYLKVSGQQPHILQLHDWHAAACALLYWDCYHHEGLWRPRIMLTIHNLDNTGECRQDEFAFTGIPGEPFAQIDKALDERTIGHNPERLNLIKGAMVYSNAITTVSPTYANEVVNGGAAGWLRSTLAGNEMRSKFHGILNGIDTVDWDPRVDPLLPAPFSPEQPQGKALCKRFLQQGLGLQVTPDKPLVAVVSRLVPQKGIHLIKAAIHRTVQQGGQFVLLGSGHSDPVFKALADGEFKDHPNCRLLIMYSERLAHMIYGAADVLVVPSMFEPCGLTQLIALRYGAVPLVRRTGGLADTVFDVDKHPEEKANGYSFDGADDASLFGALDRALKHYTERPDSWKALTLRNMHEDVSWSHSAKSYVQLYNSIAHKS